MLTLTVLRHARTTWNDRGLMQGRRDIPLSPEGRAEAQRWRLSSELAAEAELVASPLSRAVETATHVMGRAPRTEGALTEMDWGEWEGLTLEALRARHGAAFVDNERRGLDFRPPHGESPRDVVRRVEVWLRRVASNGRPIVAVTHKGVLRALLVIATGWDMSCKPPVKLQPACLHTFVLDADGALSILRCNVPLTAMAGEMQA